MDFMITPLLFKRLVYIFLTTATAILIDTFFPARDSYWLVWTTTLLTLVFLGETLWHRLIVMSVVGLTMILIVWMASELASSIIVISIFLLGVTGLSMVLTARYPHYFYPFFLISISAILALYLPVAGTDHAERYFFMLAGLVIALLFQIIFLFHFKIDHLYAGLVTSLRQLTRLNDEIFSCLLQPTYPSNLYLFERRLHVQTICFLKAISGARLTVQSMTKETDAVKLELFLHRLDQLFNILMDLSQLRRRVTDHTIFDVCRSEMMSVLAAIDSFLLDIERALLSNQAPAPVESLTDQIRRLEEIYLNVLQVTAREPLVFLLFIASLKALRDELLLSFDEALQIKRRLARS